MLIFFGHRLYGKTDIVPGFFHVATKFSHIDYIPIFPTGSFLVLSQNGENFTGVPIPMSGKSILLCWGRAAAIGLATTFGVVAVTLFADGHSSELPTAILSLVVTAASITAIVLSYTLKFLTHASYDRAHALALKAGISADGIANLRRHFGLSDDYSPVHGFPVAPVPVTPTPAQTQLADQGPIPPQTTEASAPPR